MNLLLSLTQQENTHPYRFPGTGILVYSFEEALYHVYHHWKQSVDDVVSPALATWVHDTLGLTRIAAKIKEIAAIESFSGRMLAFLKIATYFDEEELVALRPDFERWEKRLEWETYKERADDLVNRGEPDKAIALYRRALQYDENIPVLNNLSVAYMQMGEPEPACRYLERACTLDPRNLNLLLHYGEALISSEQFETAERVIKLAASTGEASTGAASTRSASTGAASSGTSGGPDSIKADILYLRGEMSLKKNQPIEAVSFFEQAIAIRPEEQYVFRLADVYAGMRQFEKALDVVLDDSKNKEETKPLLPRLIKEAELQFLADNLPAAISAISRAIEVRPGNAELFVMLARYYRLNYDLVRAEEAITKACALDANNERVRLELAKVQKNMGNTRAYQQLLKGILTDFKGRYREQ